MSNNEKLVNGSVIKSSGAIQISSEKLSLLQRKCFNILLFNAWRDLHIKDIFRIKLSDLRYALDYHDLPNLKDNLKQLMHTIVEFNCLGSRDKSEWQWEGMTLLAESAISSDGTTLRYGYAPTMRQKLQDPLVYARIDLAIQRNFRTKYALILYELACDHYIAATSKGHTPFIELRDLRKLLGCAEDKSYDNFFEFNRYVLKKAVKEINEKSDLQIEMKQKKRGKNVVAIQFVITQNKSGMIAELYAPKQAEMPLAPGGAIYTRLVNEYGLSEKQATHIVNNYEQQRIEDVMGYVARRQAAGKVDNIASLTVSAFENNYRMPTTPPDPNKNDADGSNKALVLEGRRIEIDDGTVHTIEEGDVIRIDGGIIPRGEIIRKLKSGEFKIVEPAEYLVPDQQKEEQSQQKTKPKARKLRKDLRKEE